MAVSPYCGNAEGSIDLLVSGGSGNVVVAMNGGPFQNQFSYRQLGAGNYAFVVKDDNDCTTEASVLLQSVPNPSISQMNQTATTCGKSNGSVSFETRGGIGPISISWMAPLLWKKIVLKI